MPQIVSLVAGSASYAKLPEMLVQLEAGGRRVTGLSLDNDQAFETPDDVAHPCEGSLALYKLYNDALAPHVESWASNYGS